MPTTWNVYGTADLNGDGIGDLLWENSSGSVAVWFMNGSSIASTASLGSVPSNWSIAGDDSNGEIYWRDTAGDLAILAGERIEHYGDRQPWQCAKQLEDHGLRRFQRRRRHRHSVARFHQRHGRDLVHDQLDDDQLDRNVARCRAAPTGASCRPATTTATAKSDIFWIDSSGNIAVWFMNGGTIASTAGYGNVGTTWNVQAVNAE